MFSLYMRHALCIFFFFFFFFFFFTVQAQNQSGQIAQFLNRQCTDKSLVNATVTLDLDTCLVTSGIVGIVPKLLPNCPTGSATLQVYKDLACASPNTSSVDDINNCFNNGNFGIPAVMFICGSVADGGPEPTSTITLTAGSVLVPVPDVTGGATATTSTPIVVSSQPAATESTELVTSPTIIPAVSPPLNPSQTTTDTDSAGGDLGSGSGLSHRDQILLGVVLPVGSLVVALLAWLCPIPLWKRGVGGRGGYGDCYWMLVDPGVQHMPHWHRG